MQYADDAPFNCLYCIYWLWLYGNKKYWDLLFVLCIGNVKDTHSKKQNWDNKSTPINRGKGISLVEMQN